MSAGNDQCPWHTKCPRRITFARYRRALIADRRWLLASAQRKAASAIQSVRRGECRPVGRQHQLLVGSTVITAHRHPSPTCSGSHRATSNPPVTSSQHLLQEESSTCHNYGVQVPPAAGDWGWPLQGRGDMGWRHTEVSGERRQHYGTRRAHTAHYHLALSGIVRGGRWVVDHGRERGGIAGDLMVCAT